MERWSGGDINDSHLCQGFKSGPSPEKKNPNQNKKNPQLNKTSEKATRKEVQKRGFAHLCGSDLC